MDYLRLKLDAAVRDVAYQGVEFDSATAKVEVIGKSINVTLLELVREDGRMKLDGSYLGTDLVFTVESDLKPGDQLLSTGMGGVFPPGYPVAEITRVERAATATFALVEARPTALLDRDHEVLLVWFKPPVSPEPPAAAGGDESARAAPARPPAPDAGGTE